VLINPPEGTPDMRKFILFELLRRFMRRRRHH
jgi:hypothetical protein